MIVSGARRSGLSLAGARWRWLIAVFIASLVSVPVAGAASPSERAPAVSGPLARPAQAQALAGTIVKLLAQGAVNKAGGEGFGWVLDQFGLGNGLENDIAGIRSQLEEIQNRLTALDGAVAQLKSDVLQSEYSTLVGQTSKLTSDIDAMMSRLTEVANPPPDRTAEGQVEYTRETMRLIGERLMGGEQLQLARTISGEAGSDGLIKAFSKAMKARSPFWTDRTSEQVREVLDYYQLEEARLLTVRVEYMHTHRVAYPESTIKKDIDDVEQELGKQEKALLKPSPPRFDIADTRTNLLWNYSPFENGWTFSEAKNLLGRDDRLPSPGEVEKFIAGWTGPNWGFWLVNEAKLREGISDITPSYFLGVWTSEEIRRRAGLGGNTYQVYINAFGERKENSEFLNPGYRAGLLRVHRRTETYWW